MRPIHIHIDTTVETVYGRQHGGRKGHNPKNRGKKGLRPVLCFIQETREYFTGKLRRGETIGGVQRSDVSARWLGLCLPVRQHAPTQRDAV